MRVALLVVALFCGFLLNLGGAPLFDRDEGAFSEATREMFDRGDFVSPYLNGRPRYDKPILTYWAQAAAVAVLGPTEAAFRLPSAVFAILWVLALVHFAGARLGRDTALAAGVLMATAVGIIIVGRAAIADSLLNLLVALAVFDYYRWNEERRRAPHLRFFLWMALGFLAKGPVAVLVPVSVALLHLAVQRRWRDARTLLACPLGMLLFALVVFPWFGLQYRAEGSAFLRAFFLTHNVERFLSPMEGHGGTIFYYVLVLPLAALPWSALLVRVVPRVRHWRRDPLDAFCWLWCGLVFVFFTISGTKLPHYACLAVTPLALLAARHREDLRSRLAALAPPVIFLALLAALPWLVATARPMVQDAYAAAWLADARAAFGPGYVVALAAGLVIIVASGFARSLAPWRLLEVAGITTAVLLALVIAPAVGAAAQGPVKAAALASRYLDIPVVTWDLNHPSISVYRRAATPDRRPEPGEACITKMTRLQELPGAEVVFRRGGIVLAVRPATPVR